MNPDIPPEPKTRADCIESDNGQVYWLSSAQLLSFVHGPNPVRSDEPGAPPESGVLRFGNAGVTLTGSGLARVGQLLSEGNLSRLRSLPWRLRDSNARPPWIASVSVSLTPEL